MKTLKSGSMYLVVVDSDEVSPDEISSKLKEAGISATVIGVPCLREKVDFYEIKRPFWKIWF